MSIICSICSIYSIIITVLLYLFTICCIRNKSIKPSKLFELPETSELLELPENDLYIVKLCDEIVELKNKEKIEIEFNEEEKLLNEINDDEGIYY